MRSLGPFVVLNQRMFTFLVTFRDLNGDEYKNPETTLFNGGFEVIDMEVGGRHETFPRQFYA